MAMQSKVVREGISAGLIGATSIAVWFFILDAVQGNLLGTPVLLGTSLGSLVLQGGVPSTAGAFLGYSIFHFTLFLIAGLVFSYVVNGSEKSPSAMIGFGMLFVAFEVGWLGWTMVLARGLGELTWLQVFVANLIAAAAMGLYMWRQHPALANRVDSALAGVVE